MLGVEDGGADTIPAIVSVLQQRLEFRSEELLVRFVTDLRRMLEAGYVSICHSVGAKYERISDFDVDSIPRFLSFDAHSGYWKWNDTEGTAIPMVAIEQEGFDLLSR